MSSGRKKWLGASAIVLVLAIPFVVKQTRGESGTGVDLAKVSEQQIRTTILASGSLAYVSEVTLTAELVARVQTIEVREGDMVEKGQLLASLDPDAFRNAIEREEAGQRQGSISIERQRTNLALREKQFERSRKLLAAQMIDQNRFDEDRNQLDLARVELRSSEESLRRANAVLEEAREQLGRTKILSPISGQVVSLPIKVGETAIPSSSSLAGAQLMTIADTSSIQAELKVDEADIGRVTLGQSVEVHAVAFPKIALKGKVSSVALAPTVDGLGRAYKVTVLLAPPRDVLLRSGMSARADIYLDDGAKRLAVPVEAVNTELAEDKKSTHFVWLQRNGTATKVAVEPGISDDRWQEVGAPLAKGDVVVVGPAKTLHNLREGDRVMQRPAKESTDDAMAEGGSK
jgi:HlyD family secretion protein